MSKDDRTFHKPVVQTLVYVALGGVVGLVWGFMMDSYLQGFILLPLVSGLLAGVYLSGVYRLRKTSVSLVVRVSIGISIGLILGTLPGMVLGTILSIPFPDTYWPFFYLLGHFVGMFVTSIGISRWLIHLGTRNQ